jgi:hypothetical protein
LRIREDGKTYLNGKQSDGDENQGAESGASDIEMAEGVTGWGSGIRVLVRRGESDEGSKRGGCYCGCEGGLGEGYGGCHDLVGGKEDGKTRDLIV